MIETKFKNTEIGLIPEDWQVKELGEICDRITVGIANTATHAYCDNGIVMLRNQNIKENYIDESDIVYISEDFAEKYNNKKLRENDLLVVRTGYPGITCVVPEKFKDCQTFTTLIASPYSPYNSYFLSLYMNSKKGKAFFDSAQIGGAQRNVNAHSLKSMPIPLPPLPEQRRIAEVLSQADELIKQWENVIAKKRDIKTATMQLLLTGKKRLNGFKDEWVEKKLGEVVVLITKGTTPHYFVSTGILFIKIESIKEGKIDKNECLFVDSETNNGFLKRSILQENDILFGIAGSIGKVAVVEKHILPANTNQALGIIRLKDNVCNKFIIHYLSDSPITKKYIAGCLTVGAQPNISLQQLNELPLFLPSDLAEQRAIAEILSDMDEEIKTLEAKVEKLRNIKSGMMQQLLSGKIRLVGDDAGNVRQFVENNFGQMPYAAEDEAEFGL